MGKRSWNENPWTKEELRDLIATNDEFATRCLLRLYERQTKEEQQVGDTRLFNAKGFTAWDAQLLSSLAEQRQKGGRLTEKQFVLLRAKLQKYLKQLLEVANGGEKPKRVRKHTTCLGENTNGKE